MPSCIRVHPLIASHDNWSEILERAGAQILALRSGTAFQETRELPVSGLMAALASLEMLPAEQTPRAPVDLRVAEG